MIQKILMVYPKIPTTYWGFENSLPFIGKKAVLPPLGLMTVASMLPSNYDVRLIDLNVATLESEDIKKADVVFVSAMIIQKSSFEEIVALCGECNRPVVAGGPYPISSYQEIKGVDVFVLDEAELTLPRYLADLEGVQRTKTPEQFLRELEAVKASGFRGSLFIVDDNFVGNQRKVKELLRAVVTWQKHHGFPFTFFTEAA